MSSDAFTKYHPAANLIFFLGAIVATVLIQHPVYVAVSIICAAMYYLLLNGAKGLKRFLVLIPLFVFVTAINPLFNTYGERVITHVFGRPYTLEALFYGASLAGVFVAMLLWFGCYNKVLTGDKFTSLFGNLAPAISLLLVMVFRLIPSLLKKGRQLTGARVSIGKGPLKNSSWTERISEGMVIIGTLMSWALEGGVVTSDSMRARGYGSARRSSFMIYRMTASDRLLIIIMAALLAAITAFAFSGAFYAQFTPELEITAVSGVNIFAFIVFLAYMLIPSALHIREAALWHISISKI